MDNLRRSFKQTEDGIRKPQKPETKYWIGFLKNTIKEYWNETKSVIAAEILNNFDNEIHNFQQVCPIEMLEKLENPITTKIIKAVG